MTPEDIDLTKPTEAQRKRFAKAIGEEWHEMLSRVPQGKFRCSCGFEHSAGLIVNEHISTNPTYDSPEILAKMKEKLGNGSYINFLIFLWGADKGLYYFINSYIFDAAALIDKASEFCEREQL